MNELLSVLTAVSYGFGSAFVPVINAEAYVGVAALSGPLLLAAAVLAVGAGQTAGKVVLFEGARRGRRKLRQTADHPRRRSGPVASFLRQWNSRLLQLLENPHRGAATVLTSASVGVPPLAAVSIVAGASTLRRSTFVACCLIGRLLRFAVLALPLAYATA